jgi:hypothetical protein
MISVNGAVESSLIEDLLTSEDLCRIFRKTPLTIINWRKGGMPTVIIRGSKRNTIRFRRNDVMKWAQENGKRIYPVGV